MDYVIQTPLQLSSHLRALRKARGLSQTALGEALGVGQTRVARIEGDPTAISVAQLIEVLGALGVQMVLRGAATPPDDDAQHPTKKVAGKRSAIKRRPADHDW
ncbi:MAG TPA: helix-turn-helix domain-containing protein [Albitalea sp.]|uniref:helix-turn-helix domain-containing protein n=1 Tax=Piscinibacter sp. TaxID=1903157 RepID=UPI002ED20AA9